jgi:hypothetical protein
VRDSSDADREVVSDADDACLDDGNIGFGER